MKKTFIYPLAGLIGAIAMAGTAYAATNGSPYVNTYQLPGGGVRVEMNLPQNYSGEVSSVYRNGKWQTFSTTTPLTQADITALDKQSEAQFQAMQDFFQQEQKMFQEQQAMFDQMFGGSGF
ncbi:MAG: hypothetical protein KGI49_03475 [Patescibacteria group bacterium]|nr:hypothetical protein [Patescibacteria group bacterium]